MSQLTPEARRAKVVTKQVKTHSIVKLFSAGLIMAGMAMPAWAGNDTDTVRDIVDEANQALVNLPGIPGGDQAGDAPAGMFSLQRNIPNDGTNTDHINDLQQQWWYVSIGDGPVMPIDDLGGGAVDFDDGRRLFFRYGNNDVTVKVRYTLQGSPNGGFASTVQRGINVSLNGEGDSSVSLRLYSLTNLALTEILSGVISDDGFPDGLDEQTTRTGLDRVTVADINIGNGRLVSEAVTATNEIPDAIQVSGSAADLLAQILSGSNLTNTAVGQGVAGDPTGSNSAFAMQWNADIGAGAANSFTVTSVTNIVPEPASMMLLGVGVALLGLRRRR